MLVAFCIFLVVVNLCLMSLIYLLTTYSSTSSYNSIWNSRKAVKQLLKHRLNKKFMYLVSCTFCKVFKHSEKTRHMPIIDIKSRDKNWYVEEETIIRRGNEVEVCKFCRSTINNFGPPETTILVIPTDKLQAVLQHS